MPGGAASLDKGGWKQMRQALDEIGAPETDGRVDIATGQPITHESSQHRKGLGFSKWRQTS